MVETRGYVPKRGEAVWLNFDPHAGHEQAGRRPAVVLSPEAYNRRVGLAIFCPITNQVKGYPFEVAIPPRLDVTGVILSDQIKNLDWRARHATLICALPMEIIGMVLQKAGTLLERKDVA